MNDILKFGERLKELRLEKGLKQSQLAEKFHVKTSTVSRWEAGIMEPDFLTLINLSKFFKVTTDYLLGQED